MARIGATHQAVASAPPALVVMLRSFQWHLAAENEAPRSLHTYTESLTQFAAFLVVQDMPTDPALVAREGVEEFVADLLTRHNPATASNRYRALQPTFPA